MSSNRRRFISKHHSFSRKKHLLPELVEIPLNIIPLIAPSTTTIYPTGDGWTGA